MQDCIQWVGAAGKNGYGQRWRKGKREYAHRAAWADERGPIPPGMHVHHRCGNPMCVNVAHMELLSNEDHHGAAGHGKLTQADADEIRRLLAAGSRGIDIAASYGISKALVSMIKSGHRWAAA